MNNAAQKLLQGIDGLDIVESLRSITEQFPGKVIFSTSFGWEDQAISHIIFRNDLPIKVFTLDTGRLFTETYYVWNRTLELYGKPIVAYHPDAEALQNLVSTRGPNSFYESVQNRKDCCGIRKVEPLKRALAGNAVWITGIRADQSQNREHMEAAEWDESNQMLKYHPIFNWSLDDVKDYIRENNIPYNPLHDKGFPSIGCAPCTRAVMEGEDFRAGRWWWEDQSKKECGLHSNG